MSRYQPPLTFTHKMLALAADVSERVGELTARRAELITPVRQKSNRIRAIHASLAIENNKLSAEQVVAVLDGNLVAGLPHEIQEVNNAFTAYDAMTGWRADSQADLRSAHAMLMHGLNDEAGIYRRAGVGIFREGRLLHMAPSASRVSVLVQDLLAWLAACDWHPLIVSCVFHYEFEFIHPFADGNGRMGRLWQLLILSQWRPVLAYLPVETVLHAQQESYYASLAASDQAAEATLFVEFMLRALHDALTAELSE